MKIQRRSLMKSGAIAVLATMVGSLTGCDRKTIVSWAGTAISFLQQTLPYFTDLLPSSVATLQKAIVVAQDLKKALESGSANAIDFIQQLIAPDGLFQQILNDVGLIQDEQKRKIVAGILAIAGVALNIIATALSQGSETAPPKIVEAVRSRNIGGAAVIDEVASSDVLLKSLKALKK